MISITIKAKDKEKSGCDGIWQVDRRSGSLITCRRRIVFVFELPLFMAYYKYGLVIGLDSRMAPVFVCLMFPKRRP